MKVRPILKLATFSGGKSYFTNERKNLFKDVTVEVCKDLDIACITPDISDEEWVSRFMYADGLHSNNAGYEYLFNKVIKELDGFLE